MTIQELYVFACKNDLLEQDIYKVINQFKTSSQPISTNTNTNINTNFKNSEWLFNINVEWSYEEVLKLFSV